MTDKLKLTPSSFLQFLRFLTMTGRKTDLVLATFLVSTLALAAALLFLLSNGADASEVVEPYEDPFYDWEEQQPYSLSIRPKRSFFGFGAERDQACQMLIAIDEPLYMHYGQNLTLVKDLARDLVRRLNEIYHRTILQDRLSPYYFR